MQGSTLSENNYLRSWTNELYLWYSEVPDMNPAGYSTANYFALLKTSAITPSGSPKDKFHFTYPTDVWEQLSQSGVQAGYGAEWAVIAATPPRTVMVAFTQPGSPATAANIGRGAQLLTVDGIDVSSGSAAALNAGMFPASAGENHTFEILDPGASVPRTVSLLSANITSAPVQNVKTLSTATGTVGYMLFNDQIATAESQLIAAVDQLKSAGVSDLVLDIRYNGGGYLDIASELAYMIAGSAQTAGRTFDRIQFNGKYSTTNPVTLQPLTPTPFHDQSQGFSVPGGQALPALNLAQRVCAHGRRHLFRQRSDHQWFARRRRASDSDRFDDLRQALWLLSAGQLRHDVFSHRVPGRERHRLRRLHRWLLAAEYRRRSRRVDSGLLGGG